MIVFRLDENEVRKYARFKKHKCEIKEEGAIDGKFTVSFSETSIGTITTASCACGKQKDLTDYDLF